MTGVQTCALPILGWRYIEAMEESEKYKEGLFILENELIEMLDRTIEDEEEEGNLSQKDWK